MIQNLPKCLADLLGRWERNHPLTLSAILSLPGHLLLPRCWSEDCSTRPSMAEVREKLSRLAERINLHLDVPLMKKRVMRKTASVPIAAVSSLPL